MASDREENTADIEYEITVEDEVGEDEETNIKSDDEENKDADEVEVDDEETTENEFVKDTEKTIGTEEELLECETKSDMTDLSVEDEVGEDDESSINNDKEEKADEEHENEIVSDAEKGLGIEIGIPENETKIEIADISWEDEVGEDEYEANITCEDEDKKDEEKDVEEIENKDEEENDEEEVVILENETKSVPDVVTVMDEVSEDDEAINIRAEADKQEEEKADGEDGSHVVTDEGKTVVTENEIKSNDTTCVETISDEVRKDEETNMKSGHDDQKKEEKGGEEGAQSDFVSGEVEIILPGNKATSEIVEEYNSNLVNKSQDEEDGSANQNIVSSDAVDIPMEVANTTVAPSIFVESMENDSKAADTTNEQPEDSDAQGLISEMIPLEENRAEEKIVEEIDNSRKEPLSEVALFVDSLTQLSFDWKKYTCFYCRPCHAYVTSTALFENHMNELSHQTNLVRWKMANELKNENLGYDDRLQKQIVNRKEVVTGLDKIIEIAPSGRISCFVCILCNFVCSDVEYLINHVSGFDHIDNFMEYVSSHLYKPPTCSMLPENDTENMRIVNEECKKLVMNEVRTYLKRNGHGKVRYYAGKEYTDWVTVDQDKKEMEDDFQKQQMDNFLTDWNSIDIKADVLTPVWSSANAEYSKMTQSDKEKYIGLQYLVELWAPSRRSIAVWYCVLCDSLVIDWTKHCGTMQHVAVYLKKDYKTYVFDCALLEADNEEQMRHILTIAKSKVLQFEGCKALVKYVIQLHKLHNIDSFVAINAKIAKLLVEQHKLTFGAPPRKSNDLDAATIIKSVKNPEPVKNEIKDNKSDSTSCKRNQTPGKDSGHKKASTDFNNKENSTNNKPSPVTSSGSKSGSKRHQSSDSKVSTPSSKSQQTSNQRDSNRKKVEETPKKSEKCAPSFGGKDDCAKTTPRNIYPPPKKYATSSATIQPNTAIGNETSKISAAKRGNVASPANNNAPGNKNPNVNIQPNNPSLPNKPTAVIAPKPGSATNTLASINKKQQLTVPQQSINATIPTQNTPQTVQLSVQNNAQANNSRKRPVTPTKTEDKDASKKAKTATDPLLSLTSRNSRKSTVINGKREELKIVAKSYGSPEIRSKQHQGSSNRSRRSRSRSHRSRSRQRLRSRSRSNSRKQFVVEEYRKRPTDVNRRSSTKIGQPYYPPPVEQTTPRKDNAVSTPVKQKQQHFPSMATLGPFVLLTQEDLIKFTDLLKSVGVDLGRQVVVEDLQMIRGQFADPESFDALLGNLLSRNRNIREPVDCTKYDTPKIDNNRKQQQQTPKRLDYGDETRRHELHAGAPIPIVNRNFTSFQQQAPAAPISYPVVGPPFSPMPHQMPPQHPFMPSYPATSYTPGHFAPSQQGSSYNWPGGQRRW